MPWRKAIIQFMLGALMEAEIRSQAEILHAQAHTYYEAAKPLAEADFDVVVLAARGSSDNAALYARYLIEIVLQKPVVLAAPSILTRYGKRVKYPKALAIGISQSGAAPDVSEVLEALREDGHTTLAITNTPGSWLTRAAEHTVLLNAGEEKSVAATKTYSASLLALYQVVRALDHSLNLAPPHQLPDDKWLAHTEAAAQSGFGLVTRSNPVFCLARGLSYATAMETALKLMECALIPGKGFSTADFQHGPKAIAGPGSCAIVYGEPAADFEKQGCALVEAPRPPVDEFLHPIWDIMFGQWLALFAARGRGLDSDKPQFLTKVTQTL